MGEVIDNPALQNRMHMFVDRLHAAGAWAALMEQVFPDARKIVVPCPFPPAASRQARHR